MTSPTKAPKSATGPYDNDLPNVGKMAIFVPLLIGGAIVIGALILWRRQELKEREFQACIVEEEVRAEILSAYRLLRSERYAEALDLAAKTREKVALLHKNVAGPHPYSDYRVALLILAAEAEFNSEPAANAASAERKFDDAIALLRYASGEMWEFCVLGRARTRLAQGKYEDAANDLAILLAGNPNYGAAYYWRSLARAGMGDAEGAAADRAKAENMDSWPPLRSGLHR